MAHLAQVEALHFCLLRGGGVRRQVAALVLAGGLRAGLVQRCQVEQEGDALRGGV